ncbi:protein of unknown function, DUF3223-containing [Geotalea daltonii FRC-32]|uniref:DUF3223 domain-containing protein n=1 Tax=Geotalea daltonii (strain DSM 22248 / JCM 15807 / FRC-32) TaxID=316067 RepID=B9M243_GEODF|nr:DCL family protein [Geotalea daltonii]ACM21161.1 protein of unknown function, DUF3223-containing [Geotalea daltonii FRC-32]
MAKSVELTSKYFRTQKAAMEFFKDMLNTYSDGQVLNSDDTRLLSELLQRHPEAEYKIGEGIKYFYRGTSPEYHTPCFFIMRADNVPTEFSYISCIKANPPTTEQLFYRACRHAVSDELIYQKNEAFKKSGGKLACSETGDLITSEEAEYQHFMPKFKDIVAEFISQYKIVISPGLISHGADMQDVVHFTDPNMEADFKKFHKTNATHFRICKKYIR